MQCLCVVWGASSGFRGCMCKVCVVQTGPRSLIPPNHIPTSPCPWVCSTGAPTVTRSSPITFCYLFPPRRNQVIKSTHKLYVYIHVYVDAYICMYRIFSNGLHVCDTCLAQGLYTLLIHCASRPHCQPKNSIACRESRKRVQSEMVALVVERLLQAHTLKIQNMF